MNTKKLKLLLIIIIGFIGSTNAQENSKSYGKIGLSYSSFGNNDMIYLEPIDEVTRYKGLNYYSIGLVYRYPIVDRLEIETGIEYAYHKLEIEPELQQPYNKDMHLVAVPANINISFLRYLYVRGGIFINIPTNTIEKIDKQTGIGGDFGIGFKYDFDFGISISINPFYRVNSLIPLPFEDFYQRLKVSGLHFEIMYRL